MNIASNISAARFPALASRVMRQLAERVAKPGIADVHSDWQRLRQIMALPEARIVAPGESRDLDFATNPLLLQQAVQGVFGHEHVAYNLMGLGLTLGEIYTILGGYTQEKGAQRLFADYDFFRNFQSEIKTDINGKSVTTYPRLEPDEGVIASVRRHTMRWVQLYSAAHGMDVRFEGTENIPAEGENVVYVLATHSSIYPDFFLPLVDPYVMHAADELNFRQSARLRRVGVSILVDRMGHPVVDRSGNKERNDRFFADLVRMGAVHKTRTAWYIHGTRAYIDYYDNGLVGSANYWSPFRPASAGVDLWKYQYSVGAIGNAIALASQTKRPTHLCVVTMEGAESVMPNLSSKTPFVQRNKTGGGVVYRIHPATMVDAAHDDTARKKSLVSLGRSFPSHVSALSGSEPILRKQLQAWNEEFDCGWSSAKVDAFFAQDVKEECLRILIARLRTVPPSNPLRFTLARQLIEHLDKGGSLSKSDPALLSLAKQVTDAMLAANR